MSVRFGAWCLAGSVVVLSAGLANAACYDARQQLPAQAVSGFLGNPSQLLDQFPSGGAQLISQVRDLAASDPATLPVILGLLAGANSSQQSAIGSGLGQAYRICIRPDQAYATQIQQGIASSESNFAKDSYASVNPDVPIGVAGGTGVGGGGGSGIGGPTGGTFGGFGGGFAPPLGSSYTVNGSGSSLSGGSAGGAGGLSRTTGATSSGSVSPR